MAFGKDDSQLANMGTYRQQAMTQMNTNRGPRRSGGGGGGMPTFVDRYKPSTSEEDIVRLVAGSFPITAAIDKERTVTRVYPFMLFTEHFDGTTQKSTTCSAGPYAAFKDLRAPCRGCDMFWEHKKPDGKPGARVNKRDMYAFSVIHYAPYARIPQIDRHTHQPRTDAQGKPFMEWHQILRHEKGLYDNFEQKPAHRMHWPMGMEHYGVLWEYDAKIGKSCVTCGGKNVISSIAWNCASPQCGEEIIDCESTTLPAEEILKLTTSNETVCPYCQAQGFLKEVISCRNCTPIGQMPKRASLFDVDMTVQRKVAADGSGKTTLLVSEWSEPRPIDPLYAELAKPLALDKIYAPTPWDRQIEKFGPPPSVVTRTPVNTGTTPYPTR